LNGDHDGMRVDRGIALLKRILPRTATVTAGIVAGNCILRKAELPVGLF